MSGQVAININFDTLSEILGFPADFEDPTRGRVLDRFIEIAERRGLKYSIYVVGRDLEAAGFRERIGALARSGHEIGNHSWSHHMDLGMLDDTELESEVSLSHDAIAAATGCAPRGFIAPAWCGSGRLESLLSRKGYLYDTSSFPSWLLYPMIARLAIAYQGDPKRDRLLRREDWLNGIIGRRMLHQAFGQEGLVQFPVPTVAGFGLWHTMGMMLPFDLFLLLLRVLAQGSQDFYYLCHPLDLLGAEDIPPGLGSLPGLPRMTMPLSEKSRRFEAVLDVFGEAGRTFTTVESIVQSTRTRISVP